MSLSPYRRAFALGAVAGLRSMTAPAATLRDSRNSWTPLVIVLAAGELIADKLPFAPSRLLPPALVFRLLSGAVCGGVVAVRCEGSRLTGSAFGALGALVTTYGGYTLRMYLTKALPLPAVAIAALEDAVALGCATAALRR